MLDIPDGYICCVGYTGHIDVVWVISVVWDITVVCDTTVGWDITVQSPLFLDFLSFCCGAYI